MCFPGVFVFVSFAVGDATYTGDMTSPRMMLHSQSIELPFEKGKVRCNLMVAKEVHNLLTVFLACYSLYTFLQEQEKKENQLDHFSLKNHDFLTIYLIFLASVFYSLACKFARS